jgi:hypothetical protein
MADAGSVWARRFIWTALIQGTIMFALTMVLLIVDIVAFVSPTPGLTSPESVIATGSAGTWFTIGYLGYLIVPVVGSGLSALFYHYIEVVLGRPYRGGMNTLAWAHLLLGNAAIGAALGLLMYGGYFGGAAMVPVDLGGGGQSAEWVHEHILGGLTAPISTLFLVGALGPLFGGIGFVRAFRERPAASASGPKV